MCYGCFCDFGSDYGSVTHFHHIFACFTYVFSTFFPNHAFVTVLSWYCGQEMSIKQDIIWDASLVT